MPHNLESAKKSPGGADVAAADAAHAGAAGERLLGLRRLWRLRLGLLPVVGPLWLVLDHT